MRSSFRSYYEDESGRFWPRPTSNLRCPVCEGIYIAGTVPSDGDLTCGRCREAAAAGHGPGLFPETDLRPTGRRRGVNNPT